MSRFQRKYVCRIILGLLLGTLLTGTGEAAAQGFLRAQGQKIVDGSGQEIILRGIGLGGWMLQEGYMLRTRGPQHELEARIQELVGPERKEAFYAAWLANHTRKVDIDSMAAWGYNSVRPAMHYKLFLPPVEEEPVPGQITWREEGFALIDSLLNWARANDMYVILDLHAAPGGQGKNADISDYDPDKPSLWESRANQERTIALWRRLAERYANEPRIGGYDLINEPNWGFSNLEGDPNGCAQEDNAPIWQLMQEITAAIREVDRNHMVIIGGNCWGNNYRSLGELWDDNLVISFHKYWNYNDRPSIQWVLDLREQRNVPVWLGEAGENSNVWFADAIALIESHGIGWAWWPLKKLGFNNPLEVRPGPGYQKILDYWNNNGPKPSADEAYEALMQLAENLKLEHNIYHRDVVDAMIRQPHTTAVRPFRRHVIAAHEPSRVLAVDYDLGRPNYAYRDADDATYHVATGGQGQPWNQGRVYRNDGVDIAPTGDAATGAYHVAWTEPGEWLQYTVNAEQGGYYTVRLLTAATDDAGRVSLHVNDAVVGSKVPLPNTGGDQNWQPTEIRDVPLQRGTNKLRVYVDHGGFSLQALEFVRQPAGPSR